MVEPTARRAAPVPDRVLVAAAQDGDLQAFGELVERHQAAIFRLALRMLGSRADAEDAGQEAFVQAWRHIGSFRAEASFSTWVHRIATNRCLDVLGRRPPVEQVPDSLVPGGADAATVAEGRERFRHVADAIGRLPADQRAALVLRDLQGLDYAEVAEVLEVPLSTVKGRIHRARLAVVQDVEGLT